MAWRHTNKRMQVKLNKFGEKYSSQESITKTELNSHMGKEKELKKNRKQKYISIQSEQHEKKNQIGSDGIPGFWLKNSPASMTHKVSTWTDTYKKQTYPNGW